MVHPPRPWQHDNGSPSSASSTSTHSQLYRDPGTESTSYTLLHAMDFVAGSQNTDANHDYHADDWKRSSTSSSSYSVSRPLDEFHSNASSRPPQPSSAPPHGESHISTVYFEVPRSEQLREPRYTQQQGSEWIPSSLDFGAIDTSGGFYDVEAPSSAPADLPSSRLQADMMAPLTQINLDDAVDSDEDQDVPADYYRCECGAVLSKLNRSRNQATHKRSSKHRKAMGQPRHKAENLVCRHCDRSFARSDSCRRHESTCHRRPGVNGKRRKPYRRKSRSPSPELERDTFDTSNAPLTAPIPVHALRVSHSPPSGHGSRLATSFASSPNSTLLGQQDGHSTAMEPVPSGAHGNQRAGLPYSTQTDSLHRVLTPHYDYTLPAGHDWQRPYPSAHYSAPSSLHSHDTSSSSSLMSSYDASPNGSTHMEPSTAWDSTGYHPAEHVVGTADPHQVHPTGSLAPPSRGRAWSVGMQPTALEHPRPHEAELTQRAGCLPFPIGASVPGPVNNSNSAHLPSGVHGYSTGSQLPSTAFHPSSSFHPSSVRSHNSIAAFVHRSDAATVNSGILAPLNDVELRSDFAHQDRRR